MPLPPGVRLGAYEVVSMLGAGGMGEVYRARDTRLKREVAIKILPATFANDADRLARFQREAELVAALNHPNIAQIYGVEDRALVLELVEGPTLADRIAQGRLQHDEAVPIARQIAEALEAAHERGIIHRDLKPANIKLTLDGTVKVLDFGLAKAIEHFDGGRISSAALSQSPTVISPEMTMGGVILGTAAYMSPEQARGKPVDKRADVWAFGCVLFEMLTGKPPFTGEDVSQLIASILRDEPDWRSVPAYVPARVVTVMRRCLEKDARMRLRDIGEVRIALDRNVVAASPAPTQLSVRRVLPAAAVLLAAAAAVGFYIRAPVRTPTPGAAVRFSVRPPATWMIDAGTNNRGGLPITISPDGLRLAFVARNVEGKSALWVRPLDATGATVLSGTDGASSPFWSADGRHLGYFADGKLKRVAASGGPSATLASAPDNRNGAWGRDSILFSPNNRSPIMRIDPGGGVPEAVTSLAEGELGHLRPAFLPDGRRFFYSSYGVGQVADVPIWVATLGSSERKLVLRADSAHMAYSAGYLLFVRDLTLMAQRFDEDRLEVTGEPRPIAENIQTELTPGFGVYSASHTGAVIYLSVRSGAAFANLVSFDRAGKELVVHGESGNYFDVELSDDGKRLALVAIDPGQRTRDVFLLDLATSRRTRFSFDPTSDETPIWSPGKDPTHIMYRGRREANFAIYQKPSNGSGVEELVVNPGTPRSWSPDGRFVLFTTNTQETSADLWTLEVSNRNVVAYLTTPAVESYGQFSPDGKWIAYETNESGKEEVFVAPFPPTGAKWLVSAGGGTFPRWKGDGSELYYLDPANRLMAVSIDLTGGAARPGDVRLLFAARPRLVGIPYDVFPDGKRFLINTVNDAVEPEPIHVVLNWTAAMQ